MLTHEENELLSRVGPQTPMGRTLRRYWIPAALSSELEAGGAPRRTRLLGEDFVAFRSPDGTVGVLDENCPHRGASLVLARNEDCGLRCLYHGWKIAPSGQVLETPAEPEEYHFAEKVRPRAFPAYEEGGIIWAYLGPPEHQPPKMHFDWTSYPAEHRMIHKVHESCNWAQTLEGVIDSAHSNYLHSNGIKPQAGEKTVLTVDQSASRRPSNDGAPRIEIENTPFGFRYAAIRKPLVDADRRKYVRVTLFIAPFYALFPGPQGWTWMQIFVPIDDEQTMFHFVQVNLDTPLDDGMRTRWTERAALRPGIDIDANYRKIRSRENSWLQDRAAMQAGSFTGIEGVNNEDIAVHESMGRIYDRSKEHLGTSDMAIIRMRRLMLDSVRRFNETGEPPLGLSEPVDYGRLAALEQIIPIDAPWQEFVTAPSA